jgi:V-type H+-transporting ATPase subunit A
VPALNFEKTWLFEPKKDMKVGKIVTGGDILGSCFENSLFDEHRILVPPRIKGKLIELAVEGNYTIGETIAQVEYEGKVHKIAMCHWWPVRQTRPCAEKLAGNIPLLTGQRVLDSLFPSVLGGTCAIPGAFGCGKTCISQALSKYSNSEVSCL